MPTNVEARAQSAPAANDEADWTVQTADTIDRVVTTIRTKTSEPLVGLARWVVFGLLAAVVGTMALVLLAIGTVRRADRLPPVRRQPCLGRRPPRRRHIRVDRAVALPHGAST